jgi:hypothetical protein
MPDANRLRELAAENAKLKKLRAEAARAQGGVYKEAFKSDRAGKTVSPASTLRGRRTDADRTKILERRARPCWARALWLHYAPGLPGSTQ